jgi:hypothetical protein
MNLLAGRRLLKRGLLKDQILRELLWRMPRNRCTHDKEFLSLPILEIYDRPALNGRMISDHALQCVAMAPSDGCLEVWFDEDQKRFGLEAFKSKHIEVNGSVRSFIKRADDGFILQYESVLLAEDAPAGLGAVAFFRAAQAAKMLGLLRIELDAVGGEGYKMALPGGWWRPYNGYYSWPCFGFDAPITAETQKRLKGTSFDQKSTRLLEIMAWDPAWWKENGAGGPMVFDLTPSSRSWHALRKDLLQKELLR